MSNEAVDLMPRSRDIIVVDLMAAGYDEAMAERLVADALAAERRVTVQRISDAIVDADMEGNFHEDWRRDILTILDAEVSV